MKQTTNEIKREEELIEESESKGRTQEDSPKDEPTVESLKLELEQQKDYFYRLFATYENEKKRNEIDAQISKQSIISGLLKDFIPIIEDLQKASQIATEETKEGIQLIEKNFIKTLNKYGVQEIIPKIGEKFNPQFHQAISSKESEHETETILEILKTGYQYNNKMITPAIVIIAQ